MNERKVDQYWSERLASPLRPSEPETVVPGHAVQTSLRGACAVGFSLAFWLIVLLAFLIDGDVEDDSTVVLLVLWFVSGLEALVSGVWVLVAPKRPRDRTLGLLALGILASQFLVAFMIAAARG